jgi:signal transduction histidine kinase
VTNAVQAMPEGGELTIKAQTNDKKQIQITVEDTGTGIPEEIKPKIFTPLFTTKSKGQGFGLAVCKRVIEAQNGTITFESQVGKGTKSKLP